MEVYYLTSEGPLGKTYFAGVVKMSARWVMKTDDAKLLNPDEAKTYQNTYGGTIEPMNHPDAEHAG